MEVTYTINDSWVSIYLKGELDHHGARTAIERVGQIIDLNYGKNIAMDLSHLDFMDSSGIAVVLNAKKNVGKDSFVVRNVPTQAMKIFRTARIDKMIDFED